MDNWNTVYSMYEQDFTIKRRRPDKNDSKTDRSLTLENNNKTHDMAYEIPASLVLERRNKPIKSENAKDLTQRLYSTVHRLMQFRRVGHVAPTYTVFLIDSAPT